MKERADVNYFSLSNWVEFAKFPLAKIGQYFDVRDGDHNRLPDEEITDVGNGIRYLRAQDLKEGIIDNEAPIYITRGYFETVRRSHIKPGYLLFSIMASVGNSAIVPEYFPEATANRAVGILVPITNHPKLTQYLFYLLGTELGARLYNRIKKGGLQQRTNLADVAELEFPLADDDEQKRLVDAMDAARATRRTNLAEADALLAGLDDYLLAIFGLTPPLRPKTTFAVHVSDLTGVINPDRYRGLQLEKHLPFTGNVGAVGALIEARCAPEKEASKELWDWIRIDDLPNQPWQVETLRTELGENIHGAFFRVEENDILIARLGPTIQNSKFVLCPKLNRQTVASSEFLVLRCGPSWQPEAVLWLLRTRLYREIMYARSRGATPSRYRLDGADLVTIPFPVMDEKTQTHIAAEARRRREEARRLRTEAQAGWQAAKCWFEEQLLGPVQA